MRSNMTGMGYYNSEPRNFNRGFGRGNPKPFQQSQHHRSPQPPRRGGDLFMEAGRLAVEYLVSRGMLSSNVMSGKYQNGSLRNNSGESNELLGLNDRDSSRRSSVDEDSRSYSRERKRVGHSRSYSFDLTRENDKEGSLTKEGSLVEGELSSRVMEVDSDAGQKDTTTKDPDTVSEHPIKDDGHSELQDEVGKGCPVDCLESKTTSLVQNKEDVELVKPSDDNHDKEKDTIINSLDIQQGENKEDKSDSLLDSEVNNIGTIGLSNIDTKNINMNDSEEIPSSKSIGLIMSEHAFGEAGFPVDQQKSMEPLSFMDKTFSYEEKSSGLPQLGMLCGSVGEDRGEKRPIEEDKLMEGTKKAKQQWLSVAQSDEYSHLSDLSDKHSISPSKSELNIFNISGNRDSFTNVSLPLKVSDESDINQSEKQLLSNSFKICDLNLMEGSDVHENHDVALLYPTISGPNQNISVDIDLSMRNNITNEYNASYSVRKNIEIIDLESASLEECKGSNTSMKNTESSMTTVESFSNPQNSTENPDGQDGYGFMISELLGNEVPNCPSVQPDMNSLHNDMGLNHTEGMFSEDDPIYMSLGEIPLTGLLRSWEQPNQERNPFEL